MQNCNISQRKFFRQYFNFHLKLQVDSCEDTRENTPDSDSGYVGSVVTVTSSSRTFPSAAASQQPPNASSKSPEASKSFLSEIQNVQRRRGLETGAVVNPAAIGGGVGHPPSAASIMASAANGTSSIMNNSTLADQLRNHLEERRKSKDDNDATFVPDAIAADIQKAVKMANDNSEYSLITFAFSLVLNFVNL